jgi:hypothetical protein
MHPIALLEDGVKKQCAATTRSGPCQAKPLNGSPFCFFHDPDKAEERKAASVSGGKAGAPKTLPSETPWVSVRTPADVCKTIEATVYQVANSVAYLLGLHLKAAELQIETERLGTLEVLVEK